MALDLPLLVLLCLTAALGLFPLRRSDEDARRAATFFLLFAAAFTLRLASSLTAAPLSGALQAASNVAFYAYPFFLLGLAARFQRVRREVWILLIIFFGVLAGLQVARAGGSAAPLRLEARSLAGLYIMGSSAYAAAIFLIGSRRRESVPHRRMASAGLATVLLMAGSAVLWLGYFVGGPLAPFPWAFLAASFLMFSVAFTPPAWVMASWRARETERFVRDLQGHGVVDRPPAAARMLCRAAERLMEESTATAFLRTSRGARVVTAHQAPPRRRLREIHADVAEALEQEPIPIIIERRRGLPAPHAWLLEAFETDVLAVAPIDGTSGRHGTLAMRLAWRVPFMRETLRLIDALTDLVGQAADLDRALEEWQRRERDVLEREREALEESNRLKSELLANMSHELRTPLNSILGFTALVHQQRLGPMPDEARDMLADVLASARHLPQLINGILDLATAEAGRMEFEPRTVDLPAVADEALRAVRAEAEKKGHDLRLDVDPAVEHVVVDPSRLKQVLYCYLSNAVKFTPDGGWIEVRARRPEEGRLRLEVQDSGIGIRPEDQGRLFREFEQLETGFAKRYQGAGLGLAIVKRLVEAQGGRVGVESTLGKGSTFYAELPLQMPEEPPVPAPQAAMGFGP